MFSGRLQAGGKTSHASCPFHTRRALRTVFPSRQVNCQVMYRKLHLKDYFDSVPPERHAPRNFLRVGSCKAKLTSNQSNDLVGTKAQIAAFDTSKAVDHFKPSTHEQVLQAVRAAQQSRAVEEWKEKLQKHGAAAAAAVLTATILVSGVRSP
jgi:hypothetical protein